jgi:hypothetical protein
MLIDLMELNFNLHPSDNFSSKVIITNMPIEDYHYYN